MNKIIVKIGVPIVVLGGIIAIIATTQKSIETLSSDLRINPLDFNQYVDGYISDSISGRSNAVALIGYNHLYDVIATESAISATTPFGQGQLIDAQDAEDYYVRAFSAYFAIFAAEANNVYSSTTWNDSELGNVKTVAQMLLTRQGSRNAADSLNHYIEYANGYYAAVKLISSSSYCSNAGSYTSYCNKAKTYQCYPYKNNSRLRSISSDVAENARNGWRNSITNTVEDICNYSCHYWNSYDEFYNGDYRMAYEKIKEYNSTFNTSWGSDLKTKLENKNSTVKECFNSKRESGF